MIIHSTLHHEWTISVWSQNFILFPIPGIQQGSATGSSWKLKVSGFADGVIKGLISFYRSLQSCFKFHDKGVKCNETYEELQVRLKSAALLDRTTRQSVSRLASPSRRSGIWRGGGGVGLEEAEAKDPDVARYAPWAVGQTIKLLCVRLHK